jgi:transcriptional regulator with XRE-family HTH domain
MRIARVDRGGYDARVSTSLAAGDARAFAELLEQHRIARNVTPAEMARAIGASTSQVSRWRRGGGISMEYLERAAAWMGEPLADLMPLAGYPAPSASTSQSPEPADPRFLTVRAVWDRLDDTRKQIIQLIALTGATAISLLTPHKGSVNAREFSPVQG